MPRVIISLTTIPPRLGKIGATLNSFLNQSAKIDEIRLYIPRKYKRFEFNPDNIPAMPDGVTVKLIDKDYGPATKLLPCLKDLRGTDTEILFCDDDHIYPRFWAESFLEARKHKPDCCIVRNGYDFDMRPELWSSSITHTNLPRATKGLKGLRYRLKRIFSLTLYKPSLLVDSGYVDMAEGYGGVMLRPDMLPDEVFDIPEDLWPVDDPWISGHLARKNTPVWLQSNPPWRPKQTGNSAIDRLLNFSHEGKGRHKLNTACIAHFQKNYGLYSQITGLDEKM